MSSREYWLNRGKDGPKHEGYVCLGIGDEDYSLREQLNVTDKEIYAQDATIGISANWVGKYSDLNYYLTEEKFNELFPEDPEEEGQGIPNESFVGPDTSVISEPETYKEVSLSLLQNIVSALQIGFENTEEVFILNGQRTTRSDRMNAVRLENEMLAISNVLTELKSRL
jgi:hypothetical protein